MARIGLTYVPPRRNIFDAERYLDEIEEAVEELAEEVQENFEDVVSDWQTDVAFRKEVRASPNGIVVFIGPSRNAAIWHYVDKGTRAHVIRPVRAKRLRFATGYSARTQPGRAHTGSGTASGPVVYSDGVQHPGTEARQFTETIFDKFKPELSRVVRQAIKECQATLCAPQSIPGYAQITQPTPTRYAMWRQMHDCKTRQTQHILTLTPYISTTRAMALWPRWLMHRW